MCRTFWARSRFVRLGMLAVFILPATSLAEITFEPVVSYAVQLFPTSVSAGQLNQDEYLDLVATNADSNTLSVLLNDGAGGFQAAVGYPTGLGPFSVCTGDLDGDGAVDVAVANKDANSVSILWNSGDGTFTSGPVLAVGNTPRSIVGADLNHDDWIDLVVANRNSDTISVLINLGNGVYADAVDYPAGQDLRQVVVGLLNQDAHPDLAVTSHDTSSVSILLNTGDGTFTLSASVPISSPNNPDTLAAGDVDGDGDVDLAVALPGDVTGTVEVLQNDGNASFEFLASFPAGFDPAAVQFGDVDRDDAPDIIVADRGLDSVLIYQNAGGTFSAPQIFDVGPNPYYMIVADVGGDGAVDIAVPNSTANQVSLLINQAAAPCTADLTADGVVGAEDLAILLGAWGPNPGDPADLDGDGFVNAADLAQLLGAWGNCPA